MHIVAHDLPEAWFKALWEIFDHGVTYRIDRGSYETQERLEFPFFSLEVENPGCRPLIPDIPVAMGIPNPTDMEYVNRYFERYLCTGEKAPGEQYTYGERIQLSLDHVLQMLKTTPGTNHAVIAIEQPDDIILPDPPCLRLIDFKLREGRLNMTVYFRSWDLWGGFPANLAALQLLKEVVAEEIGVQDGKLFAASAGLHLYDYSWGIAKARVYKEK